MRATTVSYIKHALILSYDYIIQLLISERASSKVKKNRILFLNIKKVFYLFFFSIKMQFSWSIVFALLAVLGSALAVAVGVVDSVVDAVVVERPEQIHVIPVPGK